MIFFNQGMLLLGSNHFLIYKILLGKLKYLFPRHTVAYEELLRIYKTSFLQNIQLQSYDGDNSMSCKFFRNIDRDSDILILSGRLFHCLLA